VRARDDLPVAAIIASRVGLIAGRGMMDASGPSSLP